MSEIPYGYCQCGCGRKTTLSNKTSKDSDAIKGQPNKFIWGHTKGRPLEGRFGRLTILRYSRPGKWECLCDCGNTKEIPATRIRTGKTVSCGCLQKETVSKMSKTHGLSNTAEYRAWSFMKTRCCNPNIKGWDNYGGRGITVCDRWLTFENFLSDMGPQPFPKAELDRIDNNKGYSPENCRWASKAVQARNKRNSAYITYNGQTLHRSEWADRLGIKYFTLVDRLKRGWTIEEVLTKPIRRWPNAMPKMS